MTDKEHIRIMNDAVRLYSLLNEKRNLNNSLKTIKAYYSEFKRILEEIGIIEFKLGEVLCEDDIPYFLENKYSNIRSDALKRLYYHYGFAKIDEKKLSDNYYSIFDKHLIFVPRDIEFDSHTLYYAMYRNVVDKKDTKLIVYPTGFEKDNYVIDDGIDIPYTDLDYYNKKRHYVSSEFDYDLIENAYNKKRADFFKYLIEEPNEDKAINRLVLKNGLNK